MPMILVLRVKFLFCRLLMISCCAVIISSHLDNNSVVKFFVTSMAFTSIICTSIISFSTQLYYYSSPLNWSLSAFFSVTSVVFLPNLSLNNFIEDSASQYRKDILYERKVLWDSETRFLEIHVVYMKERSTFRTYNFFFRCMIHQLLINFTHRHS